MVHISAELRSQGYKARDLWGRKNGRLNVQPNVVVFKEESPMVLRNFVSPTKRRAGEKACTFEMMELISCMEKFSGDKTMCTKENAAFQSCYSAFKKQSAIDKADRLKGNIPVGSDVKLSGEQVNRMMKNFPQSMRTTKDFYDPKFKTPLRPQDRQV